MFTGSDLPDLGPLIKWLSLLAGFGVLAGGYLLVRGIIWLFQHARIV